MNSQKYQQKEIQVVFNNFDTDHSGAIDISQIRNVAKAFGQDISEDQLKEIISQLDINNDGKISLEQFKFWWMHGHKGKLNQLVYLKAKSMKMTNSFLSNFKETGSKLSQPNKKMKADRLDIKIGVGQLDISRLGMDMKLGLFYRGNREKERRTRLKQKITWLNQKSTNIVFLMASQNPQKAKKQLNQLIKKLLQFLPIQIQDLQDNPFLTLKIKVVQQNLIVHLQFKQILNQIVAGPLALIDSTSSNYAEDFYFFGQIWIKSAFTVEDLMRDKQIMETLLKGFQFHLVGQVPGSISKKFRQILFLKEIEPNTKNFLTILLKTLKFDLKLKSPNSFNKFVEKLGIKQILSQFPAFSDVIEMLSQQFAFQSFKKDHNPLHVLYTILKCLKQNVKSKIQIYFQSTQLLFELFTEIPTASKLFQAIFNQI